MQAGPKFQYAWQAEKEAPVLLSAPAYIESLLDWIEGQFNQPAIFPQHSDDPFPRRFKGIVSKIFRRLFRVYAHIYHAHHALVKSRGADAHLNTCFKHFVFFVSEFQLVPAEELAPLQSIVDALLARRGSAVIAAAAPGGASPPGASPDAGGAAGAGAAAEGVR